MNHRSFASLQPADRETINEIAGELLRKLGYDVLS